MSSWIWPISRDNFKKLRASGFGFMDFKKKAPALDQVSPGDGVGVYVSKRHGGRMHIEAILEVRSGLYQRRPGSALVWQEEETSGRIEWPCRIDASLIRECDIDLPSVFQSMESPSVKEKGTGGAGLGLFLQGATLKEITDRDWELIERADTASPLHPNRRAP